MSLVRPLLAYCSCALLCLAAARPASLAAETSTYEGKKVVNILFDPHQQPLEPSEIAEILPLKTGQPFRMTTERAAIERLFATGRYADIEVDVEPYNDGVIVKFITKNSWFIGNVSAGGKISSPPNAGQLVSATRLELGQPYNETKLDQAIASQKHLLESNGLFMGDVHPVFEYDTDHQQINIRFEITSGRRAHFGPPVLEGDLQLDKERIIHATKFRRFLIHTWKPMTQLRMRQALDGVRSLYQKQDRLEAKVALQSTSYDAATNTAIPMFHIDAGPRISINTIGASISRGKLKSLVPVYEEHAVDNDLLVEGTRNIRDYLQSKGYFEAQVEVKPQRVVNDKASIDYLIAEGKRHRLVAITFRGNEYFKNDTLRDRMYLQTANLLQFPHGRYSEALMKRDVQAITDLYESNGFRDVNVTAKVQDDYKEKAGDIAVEFRILEGPQYFVNKVEISGVEKLDRDSIIRSLTSAEGQPFSEFNVAVDRDTIQTKYFENGFPKATFGWSWKPAAEKYRIDLFYEISEGQQQYVREVLVQGLKITKPKLVWHALKDLSPGAPLSPTAITTAQRQLYDLGVFAKVDAAIENPDGQTDRKYVIYNMEEAARYSMAIGVGAELGKIGGCETCFDAPAGSAGFSPRVSFDIARNNLWGVGHSLSLRTRASTLDKRAVLTYTWPRFQNSPALSLTFSGYYQDSKDINTFSFKREEASIQLSQKYSKASTLFYRFTYRRVAVDNETLKINPLLIPSLSQPVRLGLLSVTWVQDKRDDPVDTHRGIYNTVDAGLAENIFGSQKNFFRFLARNSTYHPLSKKTVIARSTQFGDIYAFNFTGDPFAAIPLPEHFFAGGDTSHRGFGYNQAGPRDLTTGFPLGGTAMFLNQTELRFPLIGENMGGVLFHDAGNVYSDLSHFSLRQSQRNVQDFDYMVHAVGFGIRYKTPIGPFRVDLAYSINSPGFIGFKATSQQDLINAGVNPCQTQPQKCVLQNAGHFQYFFSIGQTF
jgi:outer membrane protein assembly complex protein YaeT